MTRRSSVRRPRGWSLALILAASACSFETAPIFSQNVTPATISPADAGTSDAQPARPAGDASQDGSLRDAAAEPLDSGTVSPPVSKPDAATPPMPTAGSSGAGSSAAGGSADAGCGSACSYPQCDAVGSYGLRLVADVTWGATDWSDAGRGLVELYALVRVETVDAKAQALTASLRACGLQLPTTLSSAFCSSSQLQVPDAIWERQSLPELKLAGRYECDASGCVLGLDPASYILGMQLADAHGPWPEPGSTALAQFPDVDADGFAGVSLDVVSGASVAAGEEPSGCGYYGAPGWTGLSPSAAPEPALYGHLPLGLRAQLTAAMKLNPACSLSDFTASDASIGLRAAGCMFSSGATSASCTEELRAAVDQSLPAYEVLQRGGTPSSSDVSDKKPSSGPILEAVRFPGSAPVSCEEIRSLLSR